MLTRAVVLAGQNATVSREDHRGHHEQNEGERCHEFAGMPRSAANKFQLQRPAATPSGMPAARASPVKVLTCQAVIDADLPPGQAKRPQDGEVTAAAAAGHHDELPEHGNAENGEYDRERLGSAVDPGVVGGTVRALVGRPRNLAAACPGRFRT